MAAPYDVAICGFGPSGATLAGLLGKAGRRVLVLERDTEVYQLPRAVHFDHEVMRIFQTLGIVEEILPYTRATPKAEFWTAERQVLVEVPFDRDTNQGWRSDYMFHQPSLERTLRDTAEAMDLVQVRLACELVGFRESGDAVELEIRGANGETELARASYLVGCDGANSLVRQKAGLELEDMIFDEPWVVVDVLGAEGLPDAAIQYCDPARPTTLVPGALGFSRFEFMLRPGERDEDMAKPEKLRELMSPWIDLEKVEIVRAAVYRFHALVAREWSRGRVLLAGDAAHQTPPFLGQGMCAGIRDAMNLSWKLCRVLDGRSAHAIVESYGSERGPHVRTYIQRAIDAGRIICTQDPEIARVRNEAMLAGSERGEGPPLEMGLPLLGDGLFQPSGNDRHPLVRSLSPQPRVATEQGEALLDEVIGTELRLVLREEAEAGTERALGELGAGSYVWSNEEGARYFARHAIHAFLVRPDHAVFGVARSMDEIPLLLESARTRLLS